jgi:hypothetical protein
MPEVTAHLLECDACLSLAIAQQLAVLPEAKVPPGFDTQVAALAEQSTYALVKHRYGPRVTGVAAIVSAAAVGWLLAESNLPDPSWSWLILLGTAAEATVLVTCVAFSDAVRIRQGRG